MAPVHLRRDPPPSSKELVEELDELVDEFKKTLNELKHQFEEDLEQENTDG